MPEAANGREGVRLYREHRPVLVVGGIIMPEMDGIEAVKEILAINPLPAPSGRAPARDMISMAGGHARRRHRNIIHTGGTMTGKPSQNEQEYFARIEAEKKKKHAEQHARSFAAQRRKEMKELHWMHCPKCGLELQTIRYQDIEVDRCFSCNGTWLDQGELEKIAMAESGKGGPLSALMRIFK